MMQRKYILILIAAVLLLLAGCGGGDTAESSAKTGSVPVLTVGENSYTATNLESMTQAEARFNDVTYVGVPVADLLADAGYDLASLRVVKAVASDGYTVNYELDQLSQSNVIVAYTSVDGVMNEDDGDFRMVLPDQEGNLNLRMLVEIQVVE
ncbi:MAG: molybdopterin-dependent oxidoreductase [Anaerolineales bacterium]|jgi:hypothetical protein